MNPQPLEAPRKKVDRPQIAFNLNAEESRLKDEFVRLVGSRGTKPVLLEFMRRFVEHGGKISTVGAGDEPASHARTENRQPDPFVTPQSNDERLHVAGLLLLFRDKREIAEGPKEVVRGLLSNWVEKVREKLNSGKRSA